MRAVDCASGTSSAAAPRLSLPTPLQSVVMQCALLTKLAASGDSHDGAAAVVFFIFVPELLWLGSNFKRWRVRQDIHLIDAGV